MRKVVRRIVVWKLATFIFWIGRMPTADFGTLYSTFSFLGNREPPGGKTSLGLPHQFG